MDMAPEWLHKEAILENVMPNLSIKNVPDHIAESLRQRAERNHRSLQGELMFIVEQAAGEPSPPDLSVSATATTTAYPASVKTIAQIAAEHREQYPIPHAEMPMAVDIIRTERDSR